VTNQKVKGKTGKRDREIERNTGKHREKER